MNEAIEEKKSGFVFKNIHRKCILLLSDQDNAVGKDTNKYFECF